VTFEGFPDNQKDSSDGSGYAKRELIFFEIARPFRILTIGSLTALWTSEALTIETQVLSFAPKHKPTVVVKHFIVPQIPTGASFFFWLFIHQSRLVNTG
jgi:hypothetical protein